MKSHESEESIEREDDLAALPDGVYNCKFTNSMEARKHGKHEGTLVIMLRARTGPISEKWINFHIKGEIEVLPIS